ncbi:hypothetical protein IW262DRAFT_1293499 [Armillaria fumosa]|nr:hypothetical protein IW262DRAFT_1293499 [Armillaria fumosa]
MAKAAHAGGKMAIVDISLVNPDDRIAKLSTVLVRAITRIFFKAISVAASELGAPSQATFAAGMLCIVQARIISVGADNELGAYNLRLLKDEHSRTHSWCPAVCYEPADVMVDSDTLKEFNRLGKFENLRFLAQPYQRIYGGVVKLLDSARIVYAVKRDSKPTLSGSGSTYCTVIGAIRHTGVDTGLFCRQGTSSQGQPPPSTFTILFLSWRDKTQRRPTIITVNIFVPLIRVPRYQRLGALAVHYSRTYFVIMECDKRMLLQKIYSASLTKKPDPLYSFGSFTDPPQLNDTHTRGLWEKRRTRMTYHIGASFM